MAFCLLFTSCKEEVLSFLSQPVGENIQSVSLNFAEILPERYQESIGVLDLSNLSLDSIPDLSDILLLSVQIIYLLHN